MMRHYRLVLALLLAPQASGYIRLTFTDAAGTVPYLRTDNAGVSFYLNNQIVPGQISSASGSAVTVVSPSSDPVGAARAALAQWNTVKTANLNFLPLKTTSAGTDPTDYTNVIAFASAQDLSIMGYSPGKSTGAVGLTISVIAQTGGLLPGGATANRGDILDSDILLNSSVTFSGDGSTGYDLQGVITHELGHALGLNHSELLASTMFPYANVGGVAQLSLRYLSTDEISFATAVYPLSGSSTLGAVSGKVVASDGSPVKYGLLTFADSVGGNTIGVITGGDGTYSAAMPPGAYAVYAEPLSTNSVVQPGNIYSATGSLDPALVTSNFQSTLLGGAVNPTLIHVTAGNTTATPDLTVAGGVSSLSLPFLAVGQAGGAGDIRNLNSVSGPRIVASGQSVDVGFLAGGFDGTENVQIFGQGITVRSGSLHVDKAVSFSAGPLVRVTVDIAARQTPALASIFVTRGSSSLSMSGIFLLVPPKPAFAPASVVSAASYTGVNGGGAVSPGGIYSIYSLPNMPNLGPPAAVVNGGFDQYGRLPGNLAGVTVTFDGIAAPLFFVYGGQINVQVPLEVAGKTTTSVVVSYQGSSSDPVKVPVVAAQPAFFTVTPAGSDSIVGNQDYSLNTAKNPAAKNSVVTIYGTGLGQLSYAVPTGQGAPGPPAGYTGGNTCVLGGTKPIAVAFAGWTPTAVGLAQWSLVLPPDSPSGSVTVKCMDSNGNSTQQGTIYIQ